MLMFSPISGHKIGVKTHLASWKETKGRGHGGKLAPSVFPAILLLAGLLWVVVWRCYHAGHPPILQPRPHRTPAGARPFVSIIVPARNEAAQVAACVKSLLAQDYPRLEVIAIDDCSEDGTGTILRRLAREDDRLVVVDGEPPPPRRMGKAHAIARAYPRARGEWLLFTDADTVHAPWLLSAVVDRLEASPAALVTVFGRQRHPTSGAYVANLAVLAYLFLTLDFRRFEAAGSAQSLVNGQYVIVSREAYDAIGTHTEVSRYASTDTSLGYLVKRQGWMTMAVDGRPGLTTTMYRDWSDAFAGWSRSFVNGAWTMHGRRRGSLALLAAAATMAVVWLAPWIALGWAAGIGDGAAAAAASAAAAATVVLVFLQNRGPFATTPGGAAGAFAGALLTAVSTVVFVAMALAGLTRALRRGGTIWKGRLVAAPHRLPYWRPSPPRPRSGTDGDRREERDVAVESS
jgi:chlorobactene glucosyltransferase